MDPRLLFSLFIGRISLKGLSSSTGLVRWRVPHCFIIININPPPSTHSTHSRDVMLRLDDAWSVSSYIPLFIPSTSDFFLQPRRTRFLSLSYYSRVEFDHLVYSFGFVILVYVLYSCINNFLPVRIRLLHSPSPPLFPSAARILLIPHRDSSHRFCLLAVYFYYLAFPPHPSDPIYLEALCISDSFSHPFSFQPPFM